MIYIIIAGYLFSFGRTCRYLSTFVRKTDLGRCLEIACVFRVLKLSMCLEFLMQLCRCCTIDQYEAERLTHNLSIA